MLTVEEKIFYQETESDYFVLTTTKHSNIKDNGYIKKKESSELVIEAFKGKLVFVYPKYYDDYLKSEFGAIPYYPIKRIDGKICTCKDYYFSTNLNANEICKLLRALGYDANVTRHESEIYVSFGSVFERVYYYGVNCGVYIRYDLEAFKNDYKVQEQIIDSTRLPTMPVSINTGHIREIDYYHNVSLYLYKGVLYLRTYEPEIKSYVVYESESFLRGCIEKGLMYNLEIKAVCLYIIDNISLFCEKGKRPSKSALKYFRRRFRNSIADYARKEDMSKEIIFLLTDFFTMLIEKNVRIWIVNKN